MLFTSVTADLTFKTAFEIWKSQREIETHGFRTDASYVAPKTLKDYKCCAKALGKFFDQLRLKDIHPGHLMEYQRARATCDQSSGKWAKPAGANCIRKEIALLIRLLRTARVWGEAEELHFQPVRAVEMDVPRAMTPEEQHRFLHIASSREDWRFVYWYTIVGLQTTASTKELRTLRLGDILLRDGVIQIRRASAKNKYRIRTIPLVSPDVVWALERLIERAAALGSIAPHHYLFPIQESPNSYDPTQPMSDSGLKKRWERVRQAAALPWLRPYDLRHTAITRLAEAGTPIQVIMSMAGHMTLRMQQHYTAISLRSKRGWVEATWADGIPGRSASGPKRGSPEDGFGPRSVTAPDGWLIRKTSRESN